LRRRKGPAKNQEFSVCGFLKRGKRKAIQLAKGTFQPEFLFLSRGERGRTHVAMVTKKKKGGGGGKKHNRNNNPNAGLPSKARQKEKKKKKKNATGARGT